MLFNATLEVAMHRAKQKWRENGSGWACNSNAERLTNLRFADDVMLFGESLSQAKGMLEDLVREAGEVGLEVHLGKTYVLSNGADSDREVRHIDVGRNRVEVLEAGKTTMYLGRALSLKNGEDSELRHRLSRAWAKFGAYRSELTNKKYSLFDRMRLFNAVVTPSVLYGCGSWAITQARATQLRSTQRKMLRAILGKGRLPIVRPETSDASSSNGSISTIMEEELQESWVSWIHRTTEEAIDIMGKVGMRDWPEEQVRRKWRWCGHTLRNEDGRWSTKAAAWVPDRGQRGPGHPHTRWSDDTTSFMTLAVGDEMRMEECYKIAASRGVWARLEADYAAFCVYGHFPEIDVELIKEMKRLRE